MLAAGRCEAVATTIQKDFKVTIHRSTMIRAISLVFSLVCVTPGSSHAIRGSVDPSLPIGLASEKLRKHANRAFSMSSVSVLEGEDIRALDDLTAGYFVAVDYGLADTTCAGAPGAVSCE